MGKKITTEYSLILISQLQRMGGTLLSQLLDGHSLILSYPGELRVGQPKWRWASINLNRSLVNIFESLINPYLHRYNAKGYSKQTIIGIDHAVTFSFNFNFSTQYRLFIEYLNEVCPLTQRHVLNAYFYSYFKTLRNEVDSSKTVVGFAPQLSLVKGSIQQFFNDYPDGKLISILREPIGWYASMSHHTSLLAQHMDLSKLYLSSLQSLLNNKKRYPSNTLVLDFHDIIKNTKMVMEAVCNFIDITFEKILLTPTFERQLIEADSNFIESVKVGIVTDVLDREDKLQFNQLQTIRKFLLPEYYRIKKLLGL